MQNQLPGPEDRIGQIIDESYRLVAHLASGGMASVYRAEHVRNRQPFAIKVLYRALSDEPEVAARFQREVQAYRRIQHPHVVAALDFGRLPDGCLYMVLEFIQGQDLCRRFFHEKPFDSRRATKIALEVAQALVAAHAAGVVHRDLKPDNIMLIERGGDRDYVKVVDFGIAKIPVPGKALTAIGSVFGTPDYMAPEQARGSGVDARTDLYALGIVTYEMLTGATPFENDNVSEVILAQIMKPPPPLPPYVDGELAAVVMQLLAKEPDQRIQTAAEVAQRLERVYARLSTAPPTSVALTAQPGSYAAAQPAQFAAPPVAQYAAPPAAQHAAPPAAQHAAPPPPPAQYAVPPPSAYVAPPPVAHARPPAAYGAPAPPGYGAPPPSAYAGAPAAPYAAAPVAGVPLAVAPPIAVATQRSASRMKGCVIALVVVGVLALLAFIAAQIVTQFLS